MVPLGRARGTGLPVRRGLDHEPPRTCNARADRANAGRDSSDSHERVESRARVAAQPTNTAGSTAQVKQGEGAAGQHTPAAPPSQVRSDMLYLFMYLSAQFILLTIDV